MLLEPVLVGLDRQRPHQPEATLAIGKDPHDMSTAFDLLVEALQHVGRFEMLMVLPRQPVKEPALAKAGGNVSSMLSSTQPVSFEYLPDHLASQAARSRRASVRSRRSLPRQHHKHLKSTNMLEPLDEEIRRRTHVVRIFPNGESCLRLVRALAVETHENWLEQHRYLNMDDLREHKKEALRSAA